jgi:hypothetical protein
MIKLLLILILGGAVGEGLSNQAPPLLIEDTSASAPLDAAD